MVGQLEDASAHDAHLADQRIDLGPFRHPRGNRAVIGCIVVVRDRGGEADGASAQRVTQLPQHECQFVIVGTTLECRLAHRPGSQRRVAQVAGVVDALGRGLDEVQVLGEGLPGPVDACGHGLGGDVLSTLQIAHHQVASVGTGRGQREAAVSHHDRGHAMKARALAHGIPGDLRIHVRVDINKSGRDGMALGVNGAVHTAAGQLARRLGDLGHDAVRDEDIGSARLGARAVHQSPASNQQIPHGCLPSSRYYIPTARAVIADTHAVRPGGLNRTSAIRSPGQ